MTRIVGTDIDSSGGLPASPDPDLRRTEAAALRALLNTADVPRDPAVERMLLLVKEQLGFVGSSASAIDSDGPDTEPDTSEAHQLAIFKADFDRGIRLIGADYSVKDKPADLTWEKVQARLLAEKGAGLKKASEMQGGGELFGVDAEGRLFIKDRGNEPVMFGFDRDGKAIMVYNRDVEQMAQLAEEQGGRVANYYEVYDAVYGPVDEPTGYELFPVNLGHLKAGAIAAVEEVTKVPFVKSTNGQEQRSSWLNNGRGRLYNGAHHVCFIPLSNMALLRNADPNDGDANRGAIRLLIV